MGEGRWEMGGMGKMVGGKWGKWVRVGGKWVKWVRVGGKWGKIGEGK